MGREIHLLLPDLLPTGIGHSGLTVPRLPALETLLARANRRHHPVSDPEADICKLFGIDTDEPPLGALCRLADTGKEDDRYWFRAEPVHLHPDRDRLRLGSGKLELSRQHAERLIAEINSHFQGDGLHLEMATPSRWYLSVEQAPDLRTRSPEGIGGADVRLHMPAGNDALIWHARLNEMQMLLHGSAVNMERQAEGLAPVSGVWTWGGGQLPRLSASRRCQVWAAPDACAARGIAQLAGVAPAAEPESALPVLTSTAPVAVVVATEFRNFLQERDPEGWMRAVERWEQAWFAPLLKALRRGRVSRLELYTGRGVRFVLTPRLAWRLWRRRRTVADIEQTLEAPYAT